MATITDHYGIKGPVQFVDVELLRDNKLFIDPRVVRLQRGKFADRANRCTTTFFDEIVDCIRSSVTSEHDRGRSLLQEFHEPRETRLGYAKRSVNGHGSADVIGAAIWDALFNDVRAFVSVGLLKLIEDMPIFIENVAEDRTSDLTTRIIFEPLAEFTQDMVAQHPEFSGPGHRIKAFDMQIWDPAGKQWQLKPLQLPVAANEPLLLVPRRWVSGRLMMTTGRYYSKTMLDWVQEGTITVDPSTGKPSQTSKKVLKQQAPFAKSMPTIIRVTDEARKSNRDLVDQFRKYVDGEYEPLTDEQILQRTGRASSN